MFTSASPSPYSSSRSLMGVMRTAAISSLSLITCRLTRLPPAAPPVTTAAFPASRASERLSCSGSSSERCCGRGLWCGVKEGMREGLWERVGLLVEAALLDCCGAEDGVLTRLTGRRGLRCGVCMAAASESFGVSSTRVGRGCKPRHRFVGVGGTCDTSKQRPKWSAEVVMERR